MKASKNILTAFISEINHFIMLKVLLGQWWKMMMKNINLQEKLMFLCWGLMHDLHRSTFFMLKGSTSKCFLELLVSIVLNQINLIEYSTPKQNNHIFRLSEKKEKYKMLKVNNFLNICDSFYLNSFIYFTTNFLF